TLIGDSLHKGADVVSEAAPVAQFAPVAVKDPEKGMKVELAQTLDSAGADLASLPVAELANDMALPPFRLTSQFLREVRLEDG
ncbi:hypothetical protein N9982_04305, partial [Akkermansiaceae bacterium]|nr:hypothetical protein [Akkermansiaceae bacterium]